MLDDPQSSKLSGLDDFEEFITREEDFFLDGPVSRRVAVLDFDPATGEILPGARLDILCCSLLYCFLPPSLW